MLPARSKPRRGANATLLDHIHRPGWIAFAHDEVPETAGMPQWRTGEHEVARWCRLLAHAGIPADPRADE